MKANNKKSKIRTAVLFVILITVSLYLYSFTIKATDVNFYPDFCLGQWQNPQNAQGQPELAAEVNGRLFNASNSAVWQKGLGQIFCAGFQGEALDKDIQKVRLNFSWHFEQSDFFISDNNQISSSTFMELDISAAESTSSKENFLNLNEATSALPEIVSEILDSVDELNNQSTTSEVKTATTSLILYSLMESALSGEELVDKATTTEMVSIEPLKGIEIVTTTPVEFLETPVENISSSTEAFDSFLETPEILDLSSSTEEFLDATSSSEGVVYSSSTIDDLIVEEAPDEINEISGTSTSVEINFSESPTNITNMALDAEISSSTPEVVDSLSENNDFLEISYTLDNQNWHILGAINQENWQNISFDLPLTSKDDLKSFQISISETASSTLDKNLTVFLDGLWLEVAYKNEPLVDLASFNFSSISLPLFNSSLKAKPETFKKFSEIEFDEKNIFSQGKYVFASNEEPVFETKILGQKMNVKKIEVFDVFGQKLDLEPRVEQIGQKIFIRIPQEDILEFKPGKFSLRLRLTDGQNIFVSSKDFEWGVLALNFNKSIYLPGENTLVGLAVLDSRGHTLCDAQIMATIISPAGLRIDFNTQEETIKKSNECGPTTVTYAPDYFFEYQVNEVGQYQVIVEARTSEGIKSIDDSFYVKSSAPFEVERGAPIRIWPLANYQVKLKIKANQIYQGLVREVAPQSFRIFNLGGEGVIRKSTQVLGRRQIIEWQVKFEPGKTYNLYYEFDAPDIAPEFYLLGPLKIGAFEEARSWQIVSDAVANGATIIYGDSVDDGNLNFRSYIAPNTLTSELTTMPTTDKDITFVKMAVSPTRDEKIAVHLKDGGGRGKNIINGRMDILTCAGGCDESADWTLRATLPDLITGADAMPTKRRPFDVAYEQLSGRAIVVFGEANTNGKAYYCIWDGNSWSPASTCGSTITPGPANEIDLISQTLNDKLAWVRLESKGVRLIENRSNELLLGIADQNSDLYLTRWDGFNWVDNANPTDNLLGLDGRVFDITWENNSGRAMAIFDDAPNNLTYSIFTPGSGWGAPQIGPAKSGGGSIWKWVEASSNPLGDQISIITADSDNDAETFLWDGSAWFKGADDLTAEGTQGKHIATAWERFNNQAVYLWTDTNALTSDMLCWAPGTGFSSIINDIGAPNIYNSDDVEDAMLAASFNNNEMLLTRHDVNDDLHLLRYAAATGCADNDWIRVGGILNNSVEGITTNSTRLAHDLSYTPYSPWSLNWRWTDDMANTDPASWLAAENATSTGIASGNKIRLRINLAELSGQSQSNVRKRLQYTAGDPDSMATVWVDVGAQNSAEIWRYTDGPGADDDNIPAVRLSSSTIVGPFVENGTAASAYDHGSLTVAEYDFILENNGAVNDTAYYFRAYDNEQASPVFRQQTAYPNAPCAGGSICQYPRLTTGVVAVYAPKSQNWRWYDDENNETPLSALAAENIAPADIVNNNTIKLRFTIKETASVNGNNIKMKLQYSESPDFSQGVNNVTEIGSCGGNSGFCYGDDIDADNDAMTTLLLSDSTVMATHNESGVSTSSFTHLANTAAEWEFTIKLDGPLVNTTYYFRAYDATNGKPVPFNTGESYSSLITEGAGLTFIIAGLSAGTNTEGVITDISTTPTNIPFGEIAINQDIGAAQRLTVSTNATNGYQIFIYERQNLLSNSGSVINPVAATNENPAIWPANPFPGAYGYHSGDDTLAGDSTRFAPDNSYARFESVIKEVAYSSVPVTEEIIDLVLKVQITDQQEAGDYTSELVYIIVPAF